MNASQESARSRQFAVEHYKYVGGLAVSLCQHNNKPTSKRKEKKKNEFNPGRRKRGLTAK